ncbi:hypothetical protein ACLKA7_009362 [Drosophila subpalustris]
MRCPSCVDLGFPNAFQPHKFQAKFRICRAKHALIKRSSVGHDSDLHSLKKIFEDLRASWTNFALIWSQIRDI